MRSSRALWTGLVTVVLVTGLIACGDTGATGDGETATVLAAASLTDVFPAIADTVGSHRAGADIRFSFAGSSALAEQLKAGAPADAIATASAATMRTVADLVEEPRTFARNTVVIAVPQHNPAGVTGLADFARADLRLVVCAPTVPCGEAAATAFRRAGVVARPDSAEPDVRAVLTKVQLGEADAAIVYRTDARAAAAAVDAIELSAGEQVSTDYRIAVVKAAGNGDLARAFVDEVGSPAGRMLLRDAGFDLP